MGNPFVHLDLVCDDPDAAKKFYGSVFDWKFLEFPEMRWTGIDVGEGVGGGLGGKQSPSDQTSWTAYVGVDDVKATIAKAEAAGATIVVPYMEVGGMGWLGVFVDPQGATIGVWQAAQRPAAKKATKKKAAKKAAAKPAAKPAKKAAKKAAAKPAKPAKKAAKKKTAKKK
jgi:predicted enzyme related to lactoylglutathione lyase